MLDVKRQVDALGRIRPILRRHNLKMGRDCVVFVDSTALRVWFDDPELAPGISREIVDVLGDSVERDAHLDAYLAAFIPEYGHLIFLARPGVMFFPDYFNAAPLKGAHGYVSDVEGQQGMLLAHGKSLQRRVIPSMRLADVKQLTYTLLEN